MGRKARISKGKRMNPNFFVFCEGETEETYIKFLRSFFRLPIQIIPKKSDSNISAKYIERCKNEYIETLDDKTFLMFDLDVEGMLERLQKIPDTILICSNPCIELWFLLHYDDCRAELTSDDCLKKIMRIEAQYMKGVLTETMKRKLSDDVFIAIERARSLMMYENPSSSVFILLEELYRVACVNHKI